MQSWFYADSTLFFHSKTLKYCNALIRALERRAPERGRSAAPDCCPERYSERRSGKWPERYPERCAPTCAPGDLKISKKFQENERKSAKNFALRALFNKFQY